jgi:transposase InsO family protein
VLKRFFLMPTSASTVHKTLAERGLVEKARRKSVKNVSKPRFFERARPNQLWQGDIMTFRLGGHNAYLIGFIDDYSRYITSLGLYRSQTAEHVLESYRRAVAEYGVPREMLTDNGRQYTNWRGKTRFEQEMKKDRVRHIRSRPHHPMTLGKIERFWKWLGCAFIKSTRVRS